MRDSRWLSAGLFAATFATLLVEILDARLLSVLTWYHLSFLAVSLAMLGMAAGAIHVFLAGDRYEGEDQRPSGRAGFGDALLHVVLLPDRDPHPGPLPARARTALSFRSEAEC